MSDGGGDWSGRAMEWLRVCVQLVGVNLLWIVHTALGGILLGIFPASQTAHELIQDLMAGRPSDHLVRDFFRGFRRHFKRLNVLGSVFWLIAGVIALDVVAFSRTDAPAVKFLEVPVTLVSALTIVAFFYLLTVVRRTDGQRALVLWRAAFLAPLLAPGTSLFLLAELALVSWVLVSAPVLIPLLGVSAPLALGGWVVERRSEFLRLTR